MTPSSARGLATGVIGLVVVVALSGVASSRSASAADPTPYGFSGEYADARGLVDFGQRWYDPRHQVFYAADPAPIDDSAVLGSDARLTSSYTLNHLNSLTYSDPDGRMPRRRTASAPAELETWSVAPDLIPAQVPYGSGGNSSNSSAGTVDTRTAITGTTSTMTASSTVTTTTTPPTAQVWAPDDPPWWWQVIVPEQAHAQMWQISYSTAPPEVLHSYLLQAEHQARRGIAAVAGIPIDQAETWYRRVGHGGLRAAVRDDRIHARRAEWEAMEWDAKRDDLDAPWPVEPVDARPDSPAE